MKATLEFNLPEEQEFFELAVRAPELECKLEDLRRTVRSARKYDSFPTREELLAQIERDLYDR